VAITYQLESRGRTVEPRTDDELHARLVTMSRRASKEARAAVRLFLEEHGR